MKKIKNLKLISLIGILSISLFTNNTVNADEENIVIDIGDDSDDYYLQSDGNNNHDLYNAGGEYNNESSSETTTQYTQAETNALSLRNSIYGTMKDWYNQLKSNMSTSFNSGYGNNLTSITIGYVPKSEIAALLTNVEAMKNIEDAEWVSQYNYIGSEFLMESEDSEYSSLTIEEKSHIRLAIAENECENAIIRVIGNAGIILGNNMEAGIYKLMDIEGLSKIKISKFNGQDYNYIFNNPYSNTGFPIRTDIYTGFPSLRDTTNYSDRFNGFLGIAINENWLMGIGKDGSLIYKYDDTIIGGGSTASLCDEVSIALLTNYHIYSVKKDYIKNVDYTSDERRWTVYLNGIQVSEPIITENPEHELNFTEIYEMYGEGLYYVEAEQLAYVTTATYVQYDICDYLYETDTGNILYYQESLIRNSGGGSLFVNEITSETPEWHKTGDVFTVTVNDLGQFDIDSSITERED